MKVKKIKNIKRLVIFLMTILIISLIFTPSIISDNVNKLKSPQENSDVSSNEQIKIDVWDGGDDDDDDDSQCEWGMEIFITSDEDFHELEWEFGHWGTYFGQIRLKSEGGVTEEGYAYAFDESTWYATISGAVTSSMHIEIFRSCPDGVTDDCCCAVEIKMQPRFTAKVKKHGNAKAEAIGSCTIETSECSATASGGIVVGSLEGTEYQYDFNNGVGSGLENLPKVKVVTYPGEEKEVDFADIETCIINDCNVVIDVLGSAALACNADGWPWGWPFPTAWGEAQLLDWSLGLEVSTNCDCTSYGPWKPFFTIQ